MAFLQIHTVVHGSGVRPGGNNDGFSLYSPQFPEWIREITLNAYELFANPDQAHVIEIYPPFYYYHSQAFVDATSGIEGVDAMFTQLMTSDNFEAGWNAWIASKEADVAAALEDLNANVD